MRSVDSIGDGLIEGTSQYEGGNAETGDKTVNKAMINSNPSDSYDSEYMGEGEGESEVDSQGDAVGGQTRKLKWRPPVLDPDLADNKTENSDPEGSQINFGASDDSQN